MARRSALIPLCTLFALSCGMPGGTPGGTPGDPPADPAPEDRASPGVTGIGGIFLQSADPAVARAWYRDQLGFELEDWGGAVFQWNEMNRPDEVGYTVWGVFPDSSTYFAPSQSPFMLNLRVHDIDGLVARLREAGAQMVGEIEEHPNGKFAWVMDPDGRKVELWEPVPSAEDPYVE